MARDYYSTRDWTELSQKAQRRDNYTCQKCGKSKGGTWLTAFLHKKKVSLVSHHIIPRVEGGKDELNNLQTLCKSCHSSLPLSENHKKRISMALTGTKKRGSI